MAIPDTTDTLHRLRTICGHVDGIARMAESGVDCFALIDQIRAVRASLRKVTILLLHDRLQTCVLAAAQEKEPAQLERVLGEIQQLFVVDSR